MTTDLRNELERARQLAPGHDVHIDLVSLRRRHDRRARVRKVGTLTLALLIGAGVIGGALVVRQGASGAGAGPAAGGALDLPTPAGLAMPAGDYVFRHIVSYPAASSNPTTTMAWWSGDGSGRIMVLGGTDATFGPGEMPTDTGSLDYLSTDAGVLHDQMIQRMAPDGASPEPAQAFTPGPGQPDHVTAGMIRSIGELLNDPNSPPDLRAALFRVAAGLDGVTLTRDTVDPVGRTALELTVTTEGTLHQWWFDPETQQLLARTDDAAAGALDVIEAEGFTTSTAAPHTAHTADGFFDGSSLVPAPRHDPQR